MFLTLELKKIKKNLKQLLAYTFIHMTYWVKKRLNFKLLLKTKLTKNLQKSKLIIFRQYKSIIKVLV